MKVLHVNDIAKVPSELVRSLKRKGIAADLLDYKDRTDYTDVNRILCNKFLSFFKYPVDIKKYDIVHLHYPINILGIATILRSPKKLVIHLHGTEARSSQTNWFFNFILKLAGNKSKVFLYSTKNLARISKKYNKNSKHFPNPINTDFFKPNNVKTNNRVLIISALIKWKRVEKALNAAKRLRNIQFDVIHYGTKKDKKYYRQWESSNIHFIEKMSHKKLLNLIVKYPLIIGQFSGEIGVVDLQAMSCAKPLIMYSKYKIPVINSRTTEEVVIAIKKNLKNKTLGKTARKWVIKNHDTEMVTDKLIDIYKSI